MDKNVTADTRELPDISQEFKKNKPEQRVHEVRVQRSRGGLRGRWMLNSMTFLSALLAIITIFISMIAASYYYNSMSENLLGRAVQTASFLNRFMNKSNEQFISASKSFVTSSEDKGKMEIQIIQIISGSCRVLASSSSLSQGSQPGTKDVEECLEQNRATVWTGRDTTTGENVMSV